MKNTNTRKNIQNMKKIWMKTLPQRKNMKNITITQKYQKHKKYWKYRSGEGRLGKTLATRSPIIRLKLVTLFHHARVSMKKLGLAWRKFKLTWKIRFRVGCSCCSGCSHWKPYNGHPGPLLLLLPAQPYRKPWVYLELPYWGTWERCGKLAIVL